MLTTIAGILAALPLVALSHALRLYASLFAFALIVFLILTLLAVRKRWPVLSWSARIIGRVPSLKNWMEKRYLLVQSVENALFDFHHKTPGAFWGEFFFKSGLSVHGRIGGVFSSLADGREDGFLQCPGHRSIDQARERHRQFQSRKHWNLRGWNHVDRQDVWPQLARPDWLWDFQGDCGPFSGPRLARSASSF